MGRPGPAVGAAVRLQEEQGGGPEELVHSYQGGTRPQPSPLRDAGRGEEGADSQERAPAVAKYCQS